MMKKIIPTLLLCTIALCAMADVTCSFSNGIAKGWKSDPTNTGLEAGQRGVQYNKMTATLTLKDAKNVTEVAITCSSNGDLKKDNNSLAVRVGTNAFGTQDFPKCTDTTLIFTHEAANGDIVVTINAANKSVWINQIAITGDVTIVEEDTLPLNPVWDYDEPTRILPTDSFCNKAPFAFIDQNIKISCTQGSRTTTSITCMANNALTIKAIQPIKGIRINGWVRKGFGADVSAGNLEYLYSTEDDLEADPVMLIKDIDTTEITISCGGQLRCYEIACFFEANPTDTFPDTGWDYSAEIPLPLALDTTFTCAHVEDYIADYGMAYIQLSNGLDTMELNFYASTSDSQTLLPVGTYTLDNSGLSGSVEASMGRSEGWDYPSYFVHHILGIYYLVDGTIEVAASPKGTLLTIQAESYYGSTITATYEGSLIDQPQGIDTPEDETNPQKSHHSVVNKKVNNGMVTIIRGEKEYTILGTERR